MSQAPFPSQERTIAAGQRMAMHVPAGTVLHVADGNLALEGTPQWLAEHVCRTAHRLAPGAVFVVESAGWVSMSATAGAATVRIVLPAPPPGWWRLIKSRFGRSGLLLGNARPPDTKAAEIPVPHATSK